MEEDESVFAETTVTGYSEYRPRIVPESDTGSRIFRLPQPEVKPKNDLSGKRFGKLTALRPTERRADGGCTGVFQKKNGEWIAYINFQKKRCWLGCFPDKEKAVLARMRGEEMHDDFLAWYQREYPAESN